MLSHFFFFNSMGEDDSMSVHVGQLGRKVASGNKSERATVYVVRNTVRAS